MRLKFHSDKENKKREICRVNNPIEILVYSITNLFKTEILKLTFFPSASREKKISFIGFVVSTNLSQYLFIIHVNHQFDTEHLRSISNHTITSLPSLNALPIFKASKTFLLPSLNEIFLSLLVLRKNFFVKQISGKMFKSCKARKSIFFLLKNDFYTSENPRKFISSCKDE